MEKFAKMMQEKKKAGKSSMSDTEKEAKMSVLEHVRGMAQDMMKGKLSGGMKKVEVASDSDDGIADGLEKAKAMMSGAEREAADEVEDTTEEEEAEMDKADDESEEDPESESDIDAKLAALMEKKKSFSKA